VGLYTHRYLGRGREQDKDSLSLPRRTHGIVLNHQSSNFYRRRPLQTGTASTPVPDVQTSGRINNQRHPSSSRDKHSEDTRPEDEQSEDILFLKSVWPETTRRKEPEVIIEAYKRSEALLGTEARSVTEHLPVLVNFPIPPQKSFGAL